MSDFTVVRPFTYVADTLVDQGQANPNENTVYGAHNAAFNATSGHKHTGTTGDAPKLGPTSIDLTANYNWTGLHTWTQSLTIFDGSSLSFYSTPDTSTLTVSITGSNGASQFLGTMGIGPIGSPKITLAGSSGNVSIGGTLIVTGTASIGGALNMNSHQINFVADPSADTDALNRVYADSRYDAAGSAAAVRTYADATFFRLSDIPVSVANGGTGQSSALTAFGIIYANSTTSMASTAQGPANTVLHGNAAGTPFFSKVVLTADVSGILGVANGGTGVSTGLPGPFLPLAGGTMTGPLNMNVETINNVGELFINDSGLMHFGNNADLTWTDGRNDAYDEHMTGYLGPFSFNTTNLIFTTGLVNNAGFIIEIMWAATNLDGVTPSLSVASSGMAVVQGRITNGGVAGGTTTITIPSAISDTITATFSGNTININYKTQNANSDMTTHFTAKYRYVQIF